MIYDNGISAAQMPPALQLPVSHKKWTAILRPFPGTRSLLGGVFGLFIAGYTAIIALEFGSPHCLPFSLTNAALHYSRKSYS
jgi:hypothetical protein